MSATFTSRSRSGSRPARCRATPMPNRSSISASCRATSTCPNKRRSSPRGRDLAERPGEGPRDRLETVRACARRTVGRGVEQAMQTGHAEEVGVSRGMLIAQFANRRLVAEQAGADDTAEVANDQIVHRLRPGDHPLARVDDVAGDPAFAVAAPLVAGQRRAEMRPGEGRRGRRRLAADEMRHAAVATNTRSASASRVLARRAIARKPAMPGARSQVLVNQLVTGVDTTIERPPPLRLRRPMTLRPGTSWR